MGWGVTKEEFSVGKGPEAKSFRHLDKHTPSNLEKVSFREGASLHFLFHF